MFLHIGNNKNLRQRDVVGIFDSDTATVSPITKEFLRQKQRENKLFSASGELPKSFVLLANGEVWLSQLSTAALLGRSRKIEG
ncbi:MAG: extracellular matrix regulator RemB [Eubacteriales bacterium]|jgi:hypothetical protein|nr:DUF370 domain-containing protein [Clostridiales bacterium]